nr:MAG TPA: hypothetical protein [Caudoviricetes sp.]
MSLYHGLCVCSYTIDISFIMCAYKTLQNSNYIAITTLKIIFDFLLTT